MPTHPIEESFGPTTDESKDYEWLDTLEKSGTFGPIFKVKNISEKDKGEIYAVRMAIYKGERNRDQLLNEVGNHLLLAKNSETGESHENIVTYYKTWAEIPKGNEWYYQEYPHAPIGSRFTFILMEYCNGGSLKKWIRNGNNLETANDFMLQICDGLKFIHEEKKYIHRNLKPENIFLCHPNDSSGYQKTVIKIGDLGMAKKIGTKSMQQGVGASFYLAPEKASGNSYTEKSDIFSIGVIYFEMICSIEKRYPDTNILDKVGYGDIPSYFVESYSNETKLLRILLDTDPENRPKASSIIDYLIDPSSIPNQSHLATDQKSRFKENFTDHKKMEENEKENLSKCWITYKAKRDGVKYAVKLHELIPSHESGASNSRMEINCLRSIKHKNVIKYYETWLENPRNHKHEGYLNYKSHSNHSKYIFIQMEYCKMGSLKSWMPKLPKMKEHESFAIVKSFFEQMTEGLVEIHSNEIIHRDLNPSRIFLSEDEENLLPIPKIGSFQYARKEQTTIEQRNRFGKTKTQNVGTNIVYRSPEQNTCSYTYESDVYSLGIIFYELLLFLLKVPVKEIKEWLFKLRDNGDGPQFHDIFVQKFSKEKELIEWMTLNDERKRFTSIQVLHWIQHNYYPRENSRL